MVYPLNGPDRQHGLALADVTVLDLSLQLPGPYATMLLHTLGARVIKVEPPGGDPARTIDPVMFATVNAGKESLELDLRAERGRQVLRRLVQRADVLVEGFRPGVAERLGFAYEDVADARPDLVFCSISGYGQEGPYRGLPGHDLNYLAVGGGVPARCADGAASPQPIGVPVVDLAAGTTAALAIVAALRHRDATGCGAYLDVALLDTAVVWSNVKGVDRADGAEPAYAVLRAADHACLAVAVIEDKFWQALCAALEWHDWIHSPELATYASRRRRAGEIFQRLRDAIAARPRAEWLELFAEADVPAAPVNAPEDVEADPQVVERGLFVDGRLRAPLPRDLARGTVAAVWPDGACSRILAELGYSADERAELLAAGVVAATRPAEASGDQAAGTGVSQIARGGER